MSIEIGKFRYTYSLEHNHIPTCFVKSFQRYASVSQFSGKSKVDCITRKRGPISLSVSGNFRLPKINLNLTYSPNCITRKRGPISLSVSGNFRLSKINLNLTYSPNRVEELNPNQNFVIDFEEKPNYEQFLIILVWIIIFSPKKFDKT